MEHKALRTLSSKDARALVADLPMWTRSAAELGTWEPSRLHAEVQRTVERERGFPSELAQRLDDVFLIKILQLIRTRHATDADYRALDLLMGAIASDDAQAGLEAMPQHYGARWKALGDLMSVAMKLHDFEQATADRTHVSQHVWERVANAVLRTRDEVSWNELAKAVSEAPEGPKTKGGISQLLTSMQARGWLESITRGRNKFFFSGPKISESEAWRKRNQFGHASGGTASAVMFDRERPKTHAVAKAVQAQLRQSGSSLPNPKAAQALVEGARPRKSTAQASAAKNEPQAGRKIAA